MNPLFPQNTLVAQVSRQEKLTCDFTLRVFALRSAMKLRLLLSEPVQHPTVSLIYFCLSVCLGEGEEGTGFGEKIERPLAPYCQLSIK